MKKTTFLAFVIGAGLGFFTAWYIFDNSKKGQVFKRKIKKKLGDKAKQVKIKLSNKINGKTRK